jgi:hypothetical protein
VPPFAWTPPAAAADCPIHFHFQSVASNFQSLHTTDPFILRVIAGPRALSLLRVPARYRYCGSPRVIVIAGPRALSLLRVPARYRYRGSPRAATNPAAASAPLHPLRAQIYLFDISIFGGGTAAASPFLQAAVPSEANRAASASLHPLHAHTFVYLAWVFPSRRFIRVFFLMLLNMRELCIHGADCAAPGCSAPRPEYVYQRHRHLPSVCLR